MLVVETAVKIGGRIFRVQVRISGSTFTSSTCEGCLERLRFGVYSRCTVLTTAHSSRLWSFSLSVRRKLSKWDGSWSLLAHSPAADGASAGVLEQRLAGCYLLADQCGVQVALNLGDGRARRAKDNPAFTRADPSLWVCSYRQF